MARKLHLLLVIVGLISNNGAIEKKWLLGMNLNPSDGHIMGYTTGK